MQDRQRDKCLKVASEMLAQSKSVAIGTLPSCLGYGGANLILEHLDNTNADQETRAVWVQLAHKFAVPIRCVHFPAPAQLCQHNDTVRALSTSDFNPEKRSILPHSAFTGFSSRFQEPNVKEGFEDVIKVEFQVRDCSGKLVSVDMRSANVASLTRSFRATRSNAEYGADTGFEDVTEIDIHA